MPGDSGLHLPIPCWNMDPLVPWVVIQGGKVKSFQEPTGPDCDDIHLKKLSYVYIGNMFVDLRGSGGYRKAQL